MPQVSAALLRSAPSKPIASANIRRDAALSFSRPAAARSSTAVKSLRVTAIAAIVLAPHHTKSSSIQTFSDSGTPTSQPFSPLVLAILIILGLNRRVLQCTAIYVKHFHCFLFGESYVAHQICFRCPYGHFAAKCERSAGSRCPRHRAAAVAVGRDGLRRKEKVMVLANERNQSAG